MTISEPTRSQNKAPNQVGPLSRVLIVGGTHGNELTGIYLIKTFERHPNLIHRKSLEILTMFGNPQAIQHNTRYIDKDLNRCFNIQAQNAQAQNLASESIYEITRAKRLIEQYGPDSKQPIDLVIDLHSTTSNAGLMLILDHLDPLTLRLAAYLQYQDSTVKIYSAEGSGREYDSMRTLGKYRLGIEVGPIAHGTLHSELFQKTQTLIHHVLDYVEQHNDCIKANPPLVASWSRSQALTVYQYIGAIDYPKSDKGEIIAMIHPQRQSQDYQIVQPGDPMFLTFSGETISYQGQTPVCPIFINEAAYYEKGIAMSLTEKQEITVVI